MTEHPIKPHTRYMGPPCKHGHSGERFLARHECVECSRQRARERYRKRTGCKPREWKSGRVL